MSALSAVEPVYQHPSEAVSRSIDFRPILLDTETLTGTPTATVTASVGTSSPTLATLQVNTDEVETMGGGEIPIGKAVTMIVSDVEDGVNYDIAVSCGTDHGNTRTVVVQLYGRDK